MGVGVEMGCGLEEGILIVEACGEGRVWVGVGILIVGGLWVGGGYFDFGVRKRKIVPLAGFPNAWPTEFPGNGVGSLTECVSILNLNGGQYNHMHFKTLMGEGIL